MEVNDGDAGCGTSGVEENQWGSGGRSKRVVKKRINLSYLLKVICETKESCLEWLRDQGLIPKVIFCPNCSGKMKLERHESALDGYVWVCKECEGVECTARHGSWLENKAVSLVDVLMFTYFWAHGYEEEFVSREMEMNRETVRQWNKEFQDMCHSLQSKQAANKDDKDSLQERKTNSKETPDIVWRRKNKYKDPFLEFLKEADSLELK